MPDRPGPGQVPSIEENESRIVETIFAHENNWNVFILGDQEQWPASNADPLDCKGKTGGEFSFLPFSIIIILIMITGVIVINHKNHNNRIIISMNLRGVKKWRVGEETIDCIQRGSSTSVISIMSLGSHLTTVVNDIVVIV